MTNSSCLAFPGLSPVTTNPGERAPGADGPTREAGYGNSRGTCVDLVVTDLKMPVMNGYAVVDFVNKQFPAIPVFVMTGDYLPDVTPRFKSAKIAKFVSKPFSFRQLADDIFSELEHVQSNAPAAAQQPFDPFRLPVSYLDFPSCCAILLLT